MLYELVRSAHPDTDESQFVDEVQQSLRRGRFMLLIVGDGIREGAATIANFLETAGSLEFTFGLVEVGLYRVDGIGTLVQPRVIARTVEIKRIVIELPEGAKAVESGAQIAAETEGDDSLSEREQFYCTFWTEFLKQLHFDDATQPIPRPTTIANLYFPMSPSSGTAWVAAFFSQTKRRVGVYLRFLRGAFADAVYARLSEERDAINKESGLELIWEDDRQSIAVRKPVPDVFDPLRRDEIRVFLADAVNRFVNVFRPRLERIVKDLQG